MFIERIGIECITMKKRWWVGGDKEASIGRSPTHGTQSPRTAVSHAPGKETQTQIPVAAMPKNKGKNRYRGKNENESETKN